MTVVYKNVLPLARWLVGSLARWLVTDFHHRVRRERRVSLFSLAQQLCPLIGHSAISAISAVDTTPDD